MQTNRPTTQRRLATSSTTPVIHDTELVDTMDDLLDEIDSVLEENALEVTRAFLQRGGQ